MALPHSTNPLDYPARFQFGERTAPCGGKSCCTDTCIKMIVEFYKEETHPLQEIRKRAQGVYNMDERACTGINSLEVQAALNYYGIKHYKIGTGVDFNVVWDKAKIGPVIVGVYYGSYPNAKTKCGGMKAEKSGRTDCGFWGAHAVLVVGGRIHKVDATHQHRDFYVRDPDHNSPARPETPAYDIVRGVDLDRAMKALPAKTNFNSTYIIYPTKRKTL